MQSESRAGAHFCEVVHRTELCFPYMIRCEGDGVPGLVQLLDPLSINFKQIQKSSPETVKRAILSELVVELEGTEAARVVDAAVRECKKILEGGVFYLKMRGIFSRKFNSSKSFMKKGAVSKEDLRRFLEETANVFPKLLLGERNTLMLLDAVLRSFAAWKPSEKLHIPNLHFRLLECAPCRAIRSRSTVLSRPVSVVQRELVGNIAAFLARFLLKNLLDYAFFYKTSRYSEYVIYDKRIFQHWKGKEKGRFIRDYQLQLASLGLRPQENFILAARPGRPIVSRKGVKELRTVRELKILAASLDGYVRAAGFKSLGGISTESSRLHRFFKCFSLKRQIGELRGIEIKSKRLFFAKADVENCFACVDRTMLKSCLTTLIGRRSMVVVNGYGRTKTGWLVRKIRAALTYESAVNEVLRALRRKKLIDPCIDPTKTVIVEGSYVLGRVLSFLNGIRLTLDGTGAYQLRKGVPQGFELSPRLAHIYLLYFEKNYMETLLRRTCLLRYVDDYLICSTSREEIERIMFALRAPNLFGVSVRLSKCETSFPMEGIRRCGRFIKWCGWQIDTKRKTVFKIRSDAQLMSSKEFFSGTEYARRRQLMRRNIALHENNQLPL